MIQSYNGKLNDPSNKIVGISKGFKSSLNKNAMD